MVCGANAADSLKLLGEGVKSRVPPTLLAPASSPEETRIWKCPSTRGWSLDTTEPSGRKMRAKSLPALSPNQPARSFPLAVSVALDGRVADPQYTPATVLSGKSPANERTRVISGLTSPSRM